MQMKSCILQKGTDATGLNINIPIGSMQELHEWLGCVLATGILRDRSSMKTGGGEIRPLSGYILNGKLMKL